LRCNLMTFWYAKEERLAEQQFGKAKCKESITKITFIAYEQ